MAIRRAAVAGQFYEGDAQGLRRRVHWCFEHALGPGSLPEAKSGLPKETLGLVCPHAGLIYSGPAAACAWGALAQDGTPGTIVIMCPNHYGVGAEIAVSCSDFWETPLGRVKIDRETGERLVKEFPGARVDEAAHSREHSIEVQLPFIQVLYGDSAAIVPIAIGVRHGSMVRSGQAIKIAELGGALARVLPDGGVIAASSDMTHHEPQAFAEQQDKKALERIEALDAQGLLETVDSNGITTCGPLGVAAMLTAALAQGARKARVLRYHTSGDTGGGYNQVVGYAAVQVTK